MMIAFAPRYNTKGRKDATGAFQPEARRFLEHHKQAPDRLYIIDNSAPKSAMRRQVLDVLTSYHGTCIECVAFFCHGYKTGMQFGFTKSDLDELASELALLGREDLSVPLYACDTARDADKDRLDDLEEFGGDGGFADELRDALCRAGVRYCCVDAHTTAGHTSRNPHVRRFEGMGSPLGGTGGYYIVPRKNRKAWTAWRKLLKTDFRYDYPLLTTSHIHEKVEEAIT